MIKGKNEFGNLVPIQLKNILSVKKTFEVFQIKLKCLKLYYLTEIDKPKLLDKFRLRKRRFVGSYNHLGKIKKEVYNWKDQQKLEGNKADSTNHAIS